MKLRTTLMAVLTTLSLQANASIYCGQSDYYANEAKIAKEKSFRVTYNQDSGAPHSSLFKALKQLEVIKKHGAQVVLGTTSYHKTVAFDLLLTNKVRPGSLPTVGNYPRRRASHVNKVELVKRLAAMDGINVSCKSIKNPGPSLRPFSFN